MGLQFNFFHEFIEDYFNLLYTYIFKYICILFAVIEIHFTCVFLSTIKKHIKNHYLYPSFLGFFRNHVDGRNRVSSVSRRRSRCRPKQTIGLPSGAPRSRSSPGPSEAFEETALSQAHGNSFTSSTHTKTAAARKQQGGLHTTSSLGIPQYYFRR